jgi:alpha-ketoglutarate-dependent taurine dioxygenase
LDHWQPSPFDLSDSGPYLEWRADKLARRPRDLKELRVPVADLSSPSAAELAAVGVAVARANMGLIVCPTPEVEPDDLLAFGRGLGLTQLDTNLCADERAVSAIAVRSAGVTADYIPYSDRPLSWHTDGYYNPPDRQVRAWMLLCVRDAADGGENTLLDPELAYIALRDEDPALIRALMVMDAMTIPANHAAGVELRPVSTGPVFSVVGGHLHMRYSARTRNVAWKADAALEAARRRLSRLLSHGGDYTFRYKLRPGEGYVSNNVLHNRTGFSDPTGTGRLLLRTRYLDRIHVHRGLTSG